jgi:hypothetical protein
MASLSFYPASLEGFGRGISDSSSVLCRLSYAGFLCDRIRTCNCMSEVTVICATGRT